MMDDVKQDHHDVKFREILQCYSWYERYHTFLVCIGLETRMFDDGFWRYDATALFIVLLFLGAILVVIALLASLGISVFCLITF
jgi:hypothetical protein